MNKNIYRQYDSRWRNLPYPTYRYSFGNNGCGCCACTHVIIEQPKYANYTPKDVRPYMVKRGFATQGHGTTWNGIFRTLEHYGYDATDHATMAGLFKTLDERKKKGLPCLGVILFRKGTKNGIRWTDGGHYVAFVNYRVQNGKHYLFMKDSGGRKHDGWYAYETTMMGLIPKDWSAVSQATVSVPEPSKPVVKKQGYTGKMPTVTLKKGSKGKQVKYLQKFLNWYNPKNKLSIDGVFGKYTLAAVKDFQKKQNLVVDGIVGIKTRNEMHGVKK